MRTRTALFASSVLLPFSLIVASGCADRTSDTGSAEATSAGAELNLDVPAWAKEVVWYQIFVERFRNGDPANDPTLHDMEGAWPDVRPDGWEPTPWTQDWFRQEPWAQATGEEIYRTIQLRRYGGGCCAKRQNNFVKCGRRTN